MSKLALVKGTTSRILEIFIQDATSATGAGLTGLVFNSSGLTCYYHRNSAAASVAVTLVTMTVGTFTSSGFKEVDATNMPGVYQLCLPDAAYATGADSVVALLKGAANMVPIVLEVQLTGADLANATTLGLTNLDATVSSRASQTSLDTVDNFIDTEIADIQSRLPAALVSGRIDASVGAIAANAITAASMAADASAEIADAVWDEDATGHQTQGSFGQVLGDSGSDSDSVWALVSTNLDAAVSSRASQASVNTIDDFLDTEIAAIQADTDDIQTRLPAALVGGRMDSSVGAMAANTLTASALAADAVAEMQSGLSTLDAAGVRAAVGLASANLDPQLTAIDDLLDTEIAAIKVKTDLIPAGGPAAASDYTAARAARLDNLDATVSSRLASASYTAAPTAAQNADALLDRSDAVETGLTPRQALRLALAALAGKLSGAATNTVTIRNAVADSKARITATVDADGNRTAVATDVS